MTVGSRTSSSPINGRGYLSSGNEDYDANDPASAAASAGIGSAASINIGEYA
ncbi:MAG TPA: hypothetical protein VME63_09590 [Dyella sp.]|uniref:hypothetical protein n=1 Tax=Dyella sp. TaxID=1869338 RepID=UPI002BB22D35|nr:hypothetical protein [Dyella sp.]HTV85648.1 hypothetical protein [Dyella sp.]